MSSGGGLEAVERSLSDADGKFMEKLRQCRANGGANVNLAVLADRSYNLRQQVAHNAALMGDAHFVEMLEDVEVCVAPEYTLKGELDKKLYAFLAGLLKGLLRETVSVSSFAARKIQVEMTWHWYQDKRKLVLELAMEALRPVLAKQIAAEELRQAAAQQATAEGSLQDTSANLVGASRLPSRVSEAGSAKLGRFAQSTSSNGGVAGSGKAEGANPPPCPRLKFTDEAREKSEQAAIAKKLELYKHRNLSKSDALRDEVRQAMSNMYKSDAVNVVYTKRAQGGTAPGGSAASTANQQGRVAPPSGPSPYLHVPQAEAPRFNPPSSLARASATVPAALATANQRVVSHLIKKVEEDHDQREMNDAQHMLAFQQARLEEETNRRIEADTYAAQAGRTCHTILRRLPRNPGEAPQTVKSQQPSATLDPAAALDMLGKVVAPAAATEESLSAYDHYQPSALDEARLKSLLTRVQTADAPAAGQRRRHGLGAGQPHFMIGTGNTRLDVSQGPHTARAAIAPRGDVPIATLLHPVLEPEAAVPSAKRLEELKLVERIRDCFARSTTKGGAPMHVPRSVIEKSILTPDDRPYEECIKLLPRPGSAFTSNPYAVADAKKDKAGKGKGKGKGKGSK